jgi:hypothetical protein
LDVRRRGFNGSFIHVYAVHFPLEALVRDREA